MEHILTDANFEEEVLKSDKLIFVDFWAPWCGPCQLMGPIVDELAQEYEGKNIAMGKCNVDENPNTAAQYDIMSIPTFLLFKDGKMIDQVVGAVQKEKLKEMIDKHV
jgi:thioredoxin 1